MLRHPLLFAAALVAAAVSPPMATAQAQTPPVSLGGVVLNVPDIARAEKFYSEVFNLKRVFQYPPQGTPIEILLAPVSGQGGASFGLARLNDKPLHEAKSQDGRLIFNTPDAKAIVARAVAAGAKEPEAGPPPAPNGPTIIFMKDLDGYEFELYQAPAKAK